MSSSEMTDQGRSTSPLAKVDIGGLPEPIKVALSLLAISALLFASWLVVYETGGTSKAFPHIFYVPVLAGAWFFGFPGGLLAAVAAGLLCGPFMPLDSATGEAQTAINWLSRAGFFLLAGSLAGMMCQTLRSQAKALADRNRRSTLSGLPNQIALEHDLDARIRKAKGGVNAGYFVAEVQMADLDKVIATLGHRNVDKLVRSVGLNLQAALPFAPKIYNDHADTFALIAEEADVRDVREFGEALISAVQKRIDVSGLPIVTRCHVGLARYPAHGQNGAELIRACRFAIHMAEASEQKYEIFDKAIYMRQRQSFELLRELVRAIDNNELVFHYQPKLDLRTGKITSAEALVRWEHPSKGVLMPGAFIPAAEQTDLITQISAWGLKNAVSRLSAWKDDGFDLGIAVNLSARDLADARLIQDLRDLIALYDIDPALLEMEVTETAVIGDIHRAEQVLGDIRELGIRVSIDDFGTGHSGLSQLRNLPIDSLKIDQVFIAELLTSDLDDKIVRAAIDLGHHLGAEVVAEGVESAEVVDLLRAYGCDIAQGYGIAKPLPEPELRSWLNDLDAGVSARSAHH